MKRRPNKWIYRFTALCLLITGILLTIILNPLLTYANKTFHNQFTIYHNKPIDPLFIKTLDQAKELVASSDVFESNYTIDICMNDGSKYPGLIKLFLGKAFAWGFYDKVVLQGTTNFDQNYLELNGYKWNLTQLLAHEIVHCLQFNKLGFWKSKPIADIPNWKWEGYAEYVSRQNPDQKVLQKNIDRFIATNNNNWAVTFSDSTIAPREYYEYWIMIQFCIDIKKMTFKQIIADRTDAEIVRNEMMSWYNSRN